VTASTGGNHVQVGNLSWLAETGYVSPRAYDQANSQATQARTVVAVAQDNTLLGLIAIADKVKDDAHQAVNQLRTAGLEPIMLTGDNWPTARAVAAAVGIEEVFAEVLPGEKAAKVRKLQARGQRVAMVGDGINDAPALMQADVGIAIGAGSDIAIESADVVLVGDRLGAIMDAYYIARASYRKTVQNFWLAFSFNGIGMLLAITGLVSPVWAMVAMITSVSAVLLNSFGGKLLPKYSTAS
jgi:P-type E1-E2 ATPase